MAAFFRSILYNPLPLCFNPPTSGTPSGITLLSTPKLRTVAQLPPFVVRVFHREGREEARRKRDMGPIGLMSSIALGEIE